VANAALEHFEHLLSSLRQAKLEWIADEIEHEITAGARLVEREWSEAGKRSEQRGLTLQEFSDNERLMVALRILWERTRVASALVEDTEQYLKLRVKAQGVLLIDPDDGQPFKPFERGFSTAVEELERLLRQLAHELHLAGPDVDRLSLEPQRSILPGNEK
jgi:hypothetical protein